jgi:hypothetical protein
MYRPEAPEGPPGRESVLLGGEMSPSGGQNEQKGHCEGRIAALSPRTLAPGANETALLPSPSDLGPYSHANAGKSRSASESRERVHGVCPPFAKHTDRDNSEGGSAEGPERARRDGALES